MIKKDNWACRSTGVKQKETALGLFMSSHAVDWPVQALTRQAKLSLSLKSKEHARMTTRSDGTKGERCPKRNIGTGALAFAAALVSALPTMAQERAPTLLASEAFQSFVKNWQPADKPLCAVLLSQADWDKVLHPAPTMGSSGPYAPPAATWNGFAVLLVARVVYAGNAAKVFTLVRVVRRGDSLEADYRFRPTPKASSTIKLWLGLLVERPLPQKVKFRENGRLVCSVDPGTPRWIEPPQTGE